MPTLTTTRVLRILCGASIVLIALTLGTASTVSHADEGWISLFDGKTLDGWKASEKPGTFSVEDGTIVVHGPRSHLYYVGPVHNHDFTNFEFKADVMTTPGSNSGMYFHTEFQQDGWPGRGYEVQVNSSHTDPIRTGSLYGLVKITESPSRDGEWFTQQITVQGKHIEVKVNGKVLVDYLEPTWTHRPENGRYLSSGTFALQGHDPNSKVLYKNIMVKPLP
jgi:3-keto-disaccharide hydrolase